MLNNLSQLDSRHTFCACAIKSYTTSCDGFNFNCGADSLPVVKMYITIEGLGSWEYLSLTLITVQDRSHNQRLHPEKK